jgi:hypothetical protein
VLLSKDSTGCSHVMVNGREHRVEEKVCQSSILGMKREEQISSYAPMEII